MAKDDDLMKYITERVVAYMGIPKEERKRKRVERRSRETWERRWFGMLPLAIGMWLRRLGRLGKRKTPPSSYD